MQHKDSKRVELKRGPKWLKMAFQDLASTLFAMMPKADGITMTQTSTAEGTLFRARGGGGILGTVPIHPFQLIEDEDGIRVVYGTVNGEAPAGMSDGDEPNYVLPITNGSGVIYIMVTVDGDFHITSRSIDSAGSMPPDGGSTFYQQIGSYNYSGGQLFLAQAISGSQAFELCGGLDPLWGLV